MPVDELVYRALDSFRTRQRERSGSGEGKTASIYGGNLSKDEEGLMKVELGDRVKDLITGFEGIVVGTSRWLYGCERIVVRSQSLHKGKPIETEWLDVKQLEILEKGVIKGLEKKK